ncbi:polysaccharide-degrading enzyme [Planctomycetota bacterium]
MRYVIAILCMFLAVPAYALDYEVGPKRKHKNIGDVPWESLSAGDTVLIHWRAEPYREKWVICRRGTKAKPITVRGVPGPKGELPVIDGRDATTRAAINFWNEDRGVIKIGGANKPADTTPAHIVVENLEVRSARPPYAFTGRKGNAKYTKHAASLYIEKGEHITIRNCVMHDSGNGLFGCGSDILVEGCYLYGNGNEKSAYEHNNYTAAAGITFQYNRFGPLRKGCWGSNLKDRSAGLVVRYNWIEGGNRQLDLVDGEDKSGRLSRDPRYRTTFVYGNVLIEPDGDGNSQIVHYGGDSKRTEWYRKGTLYFYNNTVISRRKDNTTLFRLSTNEEKVDCRNNIVHVAASGNRLALTAGRGVVDLSRNWMKPKWRTTFEKTFEGKLNDDKTGIAGDSPRFVNERDGDYHLRTDSLCRGAGSKLHPGVSPDHDVRLEYVTHRLSREKIKTGKLSIGAY